MPRGRLMQAQEKKASGTKNFLMSDIAAFYKNSGVKHYCLATPFDPPIAYPELRFINRIDETNSVYAMVRDLLIRLALDRENIGTKMWNPFRTIIEPGQTVLIKPNLVHHHHLLGEPGLYSTIVHGSILRPLIDYTYLALNGHGAIVLADNPVESADFNVITRFTGIEKMVNELKVRGYDGLRLIDLRTKIQRETKSGRCYYENQQGDPLGFVVIDLGKNSYFCDLDAMEDIHYYTLSDRSIDHLNPKFHKKSKTDEYHNPSSHSYIVSKSILQADTIINVSKLKTHCKAGVSLALKNMIGIVHGKECMPHHRPGLPPKGDSFPVYPASSYVLTRKSYHMLKRSLQIHRLPGLRAVKEWMLRQKGLFAKNIEYGDWKGNDTIWRTILDLNTIAIYADKDGTLQDDIQRNYFCIIDGIIGQEGDGPISGHPVISSIIFGGFNPVVVDTMATKVMGIDPYLIKAIWKAGERHRFRLVDGDNLKASLNSDLPNLCFKLPKGWN